MINSYLLPLDRYRQISAIKRSALFDQEFYEAQAEELFPRRRDAVIHFMDVGMKAGLSPTPLFQDEWYRFQTSRGSEPCFLSFFFGSEPLTTSSPYFDARVFAARRAEAQLPVPISGREAIEFFLADATSDTILPTPSWAVGTPTWGEARALALESTRQINERAHFVRPRLTHEWAPEPIAADVAPSQRAQLVSAIMPVRNRAGIISGAIESVIAQTHENWELIIVDDGSTDATIAVVEGFAERDPRVRLLRQPPSGVCAARNNGLADARGDFVAFIDSDNAWLPDFIEFSLPGFADRDVVATHAAVEMVDEHGEKSFLAQSGTRDDLLNGGNFIDLNTLIARRSAVTEIGGFDEALRRWVDYDLVIRLAELGRLRFLPTIGVAYSHRGDMKRISTTEPNGWEQVVLSKYLLDWPSITEAVADRQAGLVSVVMLSYADWRMTVDAVQSILTNSGDVTFELLVLDNGSPRSVREILSASLSGHPTVRLVSLPRNTNFALGSNLAFAQTRGEFVAFVNNDVVVGPNWLAPLRAQLTLDPGLTAAQAVVYAPTGEIESAGLELDPDSGLPRDRRAIGSEQQLIALSGIASMYRAHDFARLRGFDPLYSNGFEDADLALRMAEDGHPRFAVVPSSRVTHFSVFSPGRFAQSENNKRVFLSRWGREQG